MIKWNAPLMFSVYLHNQKIKKLKVFFFFLHLKTGYLNTKRKYRK